MNKRLSRHEMFKRLQAVMAEWAAGKTWAEMAAMFGETRSQADTRMYAAASRWAKCCGVIPPWRLTPRRPRKSA